jgi:hypothetical protein
MRQSHPEKLKRVQLRPEKIFSNHTFGYSAGIELPLSANFTQTVPMASVLRGGVARAEHEKPNKTLIVRSCGIDLFRWFKKPPSKHPSDAAKIHIPDFRHLTSVCV